MYPNFNSSGSKASNNIPEWKKKLLMKKRAGNIDEHCRRIPSESSNGDNNDNFSSKIGHSELDFKELKTVTIGNLNVELRSVKTHDSGQFDRLSGLEDGQDLQYGPGIVDRLRERFLNMGAKKQRKPVRRFSSLENLPCSFGRPLKLNTRNIRQNGLKAGSGNYYGSGNVKKAQSMETLIYSTQELPIFSASRRPVKARPSLIHTGEMEERPPNRTPSINEDELPKPDTVKHVKKLFERHNDIKRNEDAPLALKETLSEADDSSFQQENDLGTPLPPQPPTPTDPEQEPSGPFRVNSIVFDFRGKDVKPNISLTPTPFGCRPARVPKRAASPPRTQGNDDQEDWDEMDIGADLPAKSGILFAGENVKVGRGAFLETRNKKLTIQFDDQATSTFEYPSENASPSPVDENTSPTDSSFNSLLALGSLANSRLSHYAPQAVTNNIDFEFGISQLNHRLPVNAQTDQNEKLDEDPTLPAIVPTKPEDASGWSSTNSSDILF